MEDITPGLLEKIQKEFNTEIEKRAVVKRMKNKIASGTATYADVDNYAVEIGEILSKVYAKNLSSAVLPEGKMHYNIADRLITQTLEQVYSMVESTAEEVQKALNKGAGIGINAIKTPINYNRIMGIVNVVSSADAFDDVAYMLGEPVINFAQSVVTDAIKENVDFHGKAGLRPTIKRITVNHCCEWCASLAGTYKYPKLPEDIYRRHRFCRCLVLYDPGDGSKQNVHTKYWSRDEESAKIKVRKQVGGGFAEQIATHPKMLQAYSPEALKQAMKNAGYEVKTLSKGSLKGVSFENGGGYKVNFGGDGIIQYHPSRGSHHEGAYYKISTGKSGIKWFNTEGDEIDVEETRRAGKQIKK